MNGAPPPVVITASPATIAAGASTVLSITSTDTTQVTVTGSDGSSYALSPTGGTQTVSPVATTTYTAIATGTGGGKVSATVTITVTPAPPATVTLTANPMTIATGSSSLLTVTAANATQVTITGTDNSSYTLKPSGGTQTVTPAATTTYTAVATGASGKVSATATVTVAASGAGAATPTVTIGASTASIAAGVSSTLTVTAANATQVAVTGSDGTTFALPSTGGTQTVSPTATTTYKAVATGMGGATASAMTTVMVTPTTVVAPTVAISAAPASISSGSSVLTVTALNAAQVTVTGTDQSSYTLTPTGGTQTVTPTTTTTYTATATGAGGAASATATVTFAPAATVTISATPASVSFAGPSTLTVAATNATNVTISGSDGTTYTLQPTGGTQTVTPAATTTYTANATGTGAPAMAQALVTVTSPASLQSITHVVFMLQENHSFDNYFGMLNPYRAANNMNVGDDGVTYSVDGIDDKLTTIRNDTDEGTAYSPFKLTSSCLDDMTSSLIESYGNVNRYDYTTNRTINMDGFVHTAEGFAKSCELSGTCSGTFTDTYGERSMGYYDESFLNYYYYMASQFAVSDRWFSPMASKSIPNRIATFTGGTTQGLAFDPGNDDKLTQLPIPTIFGELQNAGVSWKIYYTVSQGGCLQDDECSGGGAAFPATIFTYLSDSGPYLYENPTKAACSATTQSSTLPPVNDPSGSFCIDINHIAPIATYYTDLASNKLPSFSFIEAGYGNNDEHPGSGQSILAGQQEVSTVVNALMDSTSWSQSVFFLSYDEGGGPYDHVPPIPTHSNDFTDANVGSAITSTDIPDIGKIAVNPDAYNPCLPPTPGTPTQHCDLNPNDPGANPNDALALNGFAAQLGFRVPNLVISPFVRKHYVSHVPMDHTAIIKFVENRFIGPSANLTQRDAAQPNLLDFFDFTNTPWATPPTPPAAMAVGSSCTPASFGGP